VPTRLAIHRLSSAAAPAIVNAIGSMIIAEFSLARASLHVVGALATASEIAIRGSARVPAKTGAHCERPAVRPAVSRSSSDRPLLVHHEL
jgi:hypothetical protein